MLLLLSFNLHAEMIEFVVPAVPGSPDDIISRELTKKLEEKTNLKFVIIDKPGAGKNIAYSYISSTDKPTVFISSDTILLNKKLYKEGYPEKISEVIEPIFYLGDFTSVLFVSSKSNIQTLDDLISLSKIRDVRFGHGGYGTYSYNTLSKLCHDLLKCIDVPYKSGNNGMVDLLSNTIDVYPLISYSSDVFLDNKNYRAIMMMSNNKHEIYDVPLLPKSLKNLETKNWVMLFGKNLSEEDKNMIYTTLRGESNKFYTKFGLWYEYKNPKNIWQKELKESK